MIDLRVKAKSHRSLKEFDKAIKIYEELWNSSSKTDKWLAWEYADSLKKTEDIDGAITICEQIRNQVLDFKYINDLYAWAVYEKYFKNLKASYTPEEEKSLFEKANVITKISQQNSTSPYEHTIFKLFKILKIKPNYPSDQILYWLNKLDPELLSEECRSVELKGRITEIQSRKEEYYNLKINTLFEKKLFNECIRSCESAFEKIKKFHHDNDIWINVKKAKSLLALGSSPDEAKQILTEISLIKEHWAIYKELASVSYKEGDQVSAFIYAYRAALTKDPCKVKVNLFHSIALLLKESGNSEDALNHFLYERKIREDNKWNIAPTLNNYIKDFNIPFDAPPTLFELREFWLKELKSLMGIYTGKVTSILPNGKVGFISYNQTTIYFRISSVISRKRIKINDIVNFCVIDSFDRKKNQKTSEAGYIEII